MLTTASVGVSCWPTMTFPKPVSKSSQGSEDSLGLHLRGHLPGPGQRSGAGPAPLHDCGHDLAPERDCAGGHTRGACPRPGGPGRLASVQETCGPRQHHARAAPFQGPRVEPGREHLAVHAGELDLQPDLRLLQRHPRPLLRGVEQAHRSALAHHVYRTARLGSPVLINGTWYDRRGSAFAEQLVLEAPDSVRRVAATGMVGRRDQANRATVQRTLRCSQGSQGWKLKLVRQGPERWQWSGRELSRPKSLDIRRPIQGWLDEGGDVEPLGAVVAEGDRPLTFGRPDPAQDRLQANAVLVRGPDLDRRVRVLGPRLGDGLLQLFLNASRSSGVAEAGWRGRGFCTDQSIALSASQPRWGKTAASPSSLAIQAATFRLDHRPPSGGGWIKRARKRSRSPGLSTLGTPPLRRRRSPSASGPFAL